MTDFVTLPLLNPRGAYDPTIWYDPNDQITYNGVPYFCRVGIINGQPITPGSDPSVWQLLTEPGEPGQKGDKGDMGDQGPTGRDGLQGRDGAGYVFRGTWTAADTYNAGDTVIYATNTGGSAAWFAAKDNTNVVPGSDATVWAEGIKGDTGDVTPAATAAAAAALASQQAAATSAANAATSETNAATSAAAALTSKNAAATSATNAATSETNALASKNAAATSATNAATSETNALASKNAAAASATAAAQSASAIGPGNPNLVFNGSGEVGTIGWSGGGPAVAVASDGDGPYFVAAAQGSSFTGSYLSQAFKVSGGSAHTLQGDIFPNAGATGTYSLDVQYYASTDGTGSVLYDGTNTANAALGSFGHLSVTDAAANVPAGANSARVRLVITGATWTALKWRRIKVEKSVSASPYSDEATQQAFGPTPPARLNLLVASLQASGAIQALNNANILVNGSGELGGNGWATGNFVAVSSVSAAQPIFQNAVALSAFTEDISSSIVCGPAATLALSYEANTVFNGGVTGGSAYVAVEAFNSSNATLGTVCIAVAVNQTSWAQYRASGTTPANTAYVKVHKALGGTGPAAAQFGLTFRRIKLEQGSIDTLYSQEASLTFMQKSPSFSGRPGFAGNVPWDTGNLPNPATLDTTQTVSGTKTFTQPVQSSVWPGTSVGACNYNINAGGGLANIGFASVNSSASMILRCSSASALEVINGISNGYNPITCSSVTQTSDRDLKTDIEPIRKVLPLLRKKTIVSYRFKVPVSHGGGASETRIGVIAQEWQEDFPELIEETGADIDADGDFIAHQYDPETGEEIFGPNGKPESRKALGFKYADSAAVALAGVIEVDGALRDVLAYVRTLEERLAALEGKK